MSLNAMIYTCDQRLLAAFAYAIAELPLDWVLVQDNLLAVQFITQEKFDFLLIDAATDGGPTLIKEARSCEGNHTCVIFALSPDTAEEALLQLGADVNLKNPGDLDSLSRHIRDVLPLIKHERRWSRRCPVRLTTSLTRGGETVPATVLNLSQGGMMIHLSHAVTNYDVLRIGIVPPGAREMQIYGKITWRGPDFLAGIRFLGLTDEQRKELADWVHAQPLDQARIANN